MVKSHYDIIIIGAGAGGLNAALKAVELGKQVLLVEKFKPGGECTWAGCIPSKALIQIADEIHTAKKYGNIAIPSNVLNEVRRLTEEAHQGETVEILVGEGIEYLNGTARFEDANTIHVNNVSISADYFVISTGSSAFVPQIKGLDGINYLTNENVFTLTELPKSLIVVGAGAIGVELSQAFSRLGVQVKLVERAEHILIKEDSELSHRLENILVSEGVEVYTGFNAEEACEKELGVSLSIAKDGHKEVLQAEKILFALGRKPNINSLNLDDIGVVYTAKGVQVNEHMQTNIPHIYAVGDLVGPYMFSHMGAIQGKLAVSNAFNDNKDKMSDEYAWCTFTHPELARTGLTEEEAREKYGERIKVFTRGYKEVDRAVVDGKTNGFAKVICDLEGYVLGASILGERACEMLGEVQLIKTLHLPFSVLKDSIHPYPSYSELLLGLSKDASLA
ncbi:mercuric reductase [Paenibacillus sp. L3-i20]|nr:mercuric reductase [Paenibacillus sp. L3-i20]